MDQIGVIKNDLYFSYNYFNNLFGFKSMKCRICNDKTNVIYLVRCNICEIKFCSSCVEILNPMSEKQIQICKVCSGKTIMFKDKEVVTHKQKRMFKSNGISKE